MSINPFLLWWNELWWVQYCTTSQLDTLLAHAQFPQADTKPVLDAGSNSNHLSCCDVISNLCYFKICSNQPCMCIGGPGSPDSSSEVETPKRSQTGGLQIRLFRRPEKKVQLPTGFQVTSHFCGQGGCNPQPASGMACPCDPNAEKTQDCNEHVALNAFTHNR